MKKFTLSLVALLCVFLVSAQETIFQENFNGEEHSFSLNTEDLGGVDGQTGDNFWVVNSQYLGGDATLSCDFGGIPIDFPVSIPVSPDQPMAIAGAPNSGYLHISSQAGFDAGVPNANYVAAEGTCVLAATHTAIMTTPLDLSTATNTNLNFWWVCGGSEAALGNVFYTTDGGDSWQLIGGDTPFNNQTEWTQTNIDLSAIDGSPSVLLAFQFVNQTSLVGNDPSFAVDDILITSQGDICEDSFAEVDVESCLPYTAPSGAVFDVAGTLEDVIPNVAGCDSIITINLASLETMSEISEGSCGPYTAPSGAEFFESGVYTDIIENVAGCDSTITINLTQLSEVQNESVAECGAYTSSNGNLYEESGIYQEPILVDGCESTLVLEVNILENSAAILDVQTCGNYLSPAENIYNQSGTYEETIPNAAGCDSLIVINLTVNSPSFSQSDISSCEPVKTASGLLLEETGTYTESLTTMAGCDSTVTINFELVNINTDLLLEGFGFSSAQQGADYQWVDCDNGFAPIEGATGINFIPTSNGQFAVQITIGDCTETSDCATAFGIGVEELNALAIAPPFPNPTSDKFFLDIPVGLGALQLTVANPLGQVVSDQVVSKSGRFEVKLPTAQGYYLVRLVGRDGNSSAFRVVKF